ncbi:MAG TPA: hypothetical protein VF332_02310 [Vicinamibacterales bacterium]
MMRGTRVRAFVLVSVVAGLAGVLVAHDKAVPTLIRAGALVDVRGLRSIRNHQFRHGADEV